MATNYIGEGKVLDFTAGGAVAVGAVVAMGDIVGIALVAAAASGDVIAVAIEGVFTVAKTTGTAWAQGAAIDWDSGSSEFHDGVTPASGDVVSCGIAAVAAASADATGQIKLLGGALASAVT